MRKKKTTNKQKEMNCIFCHLEKKKSPDTMLCYFMLPKDLLSSVAFDVVLLLYVLCISGTIYMEELDIVVP